MLERREGARLCTQTLAPAEIATVARGQDLDRDLAMETRVVGGVHHPLGAPPEDRVELVPLDPRRRDRGSEHALHHERPQMRGGPSVVPPSGAALLSRDARMLRSADRGQSQS